MERSSKFISLSGLAGVFAGVFALLGALAVYIYQHEFFFSRYQNQGVFLRNDLISGTELQNFIIFLFTDAIIVLILALGSGIFFTTRNARKKGLPYFDATAKRMLINLFIPLVTGGLFCIALLYHHPGRTNRPPGALRCGCRPISFVAWPLSRPALAPPSLRLAGWRSWWTSRA